VTDADPEHGWENSAGTSVGDRQPRVLITGSRTWPNPQLIGQVLDELWEELGPYVFVHGAARGADMMGAVHQQRNRRPVEAHPADWSRYGKRAGYVRNKEMVDAGADVCVAFIHNGSRGATMCARLAEDAGIQTRRYVINDAPELSGQAHQDGLLQF